MLLVWGRCTLPTVSGRLVGVDMVTALLMGSSRVGECGCGSARPGILRTSSRLRGGDQASGVPSKLGIVYASSRLQGCDWVSGVPSMVGAAPATISFRASRVVLGQGLLTHRPGE